jgi:hypothetical protein
MATTPNYPPYVNGYGGLPTLFAEIKKASVPPKVTNDFLYSVLGLNPQAFAQRFRCLSVWDLSTKQTFLLKVIKIIEIQNCQAQ